MTDMTDPVAAIFWGIIAGMFLANAVYSWLVAEHTQEPIPAALGWMFLCLAIGTGLIGLLRTSLHDIIPLYVLKIVERSAFAVAAINGLLVVQLASARWNGNRTMRRLLHRWNQFVEWRQPSHEV